MTCQFFQMRPGLHGICKATASATVKILDSEDRLVRTERVCTHHVQTVRRQMAIAAPFTKQRCVSA